MRIQQILAFLGAAALSVSALAQTPNVDQSTVNVQGGKSAVVNRLTPGEADLMKGGFAMEDGRSLKISNRGAKLYAELGGNKREELIQVGPQRFLGRDSGNRVAFDQVPYADTVVIDELLPNGNRVSLVGR
jgi:hypothetical protein